MKTKLCASWWIVICQWLAQGAEQWTSRSSSQETLSQEEFNYYQTSSFKLGSASISELEVTHHDPTSLQVRLPGASPSNTTLDSVIDSQTAHTQLAGVTDSQTVRGGKVLSGRASQRKRTRLLGYSSRSQEKSRISSVEWLETGTPTDKHVTVDDSNSNLLGVVPREIGTSGAQRSSLTLPNSELPETNAANLKRTTVKFKTNEEIQFYDKLEDKSTLQLPGQVGGESDTSENKERTRSKLRRTSQQRVRLSTQ